MAAKKSSSEGASAVAKPPVGKPVKAKSPVLASKAAPAPPPSPVVASKAKKASASESKPAAKVVALKPPAASKATAAKPAVETVPKKPAAKKPAARATAQVSVVEATPTPVRLKAAAKPSPVNLLNIRPTEGRSPRAAAPRKAAVQAAPAAEPVKPPSKAKAPAAAKPASTKPAATRRPAGGNLGKRALQVIAEEGAARFDDEAPRLEAEAHKFDLGPREDARPPEGPPPMPRQLDDFYEETAVTLLVRDPHWVFVYWEIDSDTRERFLIPRGKHSGRLLLRWYDVTDVEDYDVAGAHRTMDVEVNDVAASWYQYLPEPNRAWCTELGVLSAEGNFLAICRSNVVRTPRATLAPARGRERWMHVSPTGQVVRVIETPSGMVPDEALLYADEGDEAASARARAGRQRPGGSSSFHRAAKAEITRKSTSVRIPRPISSGEFYEVLKQESEELAERLARELVEQGKGPSSGGRA